MVKMVNFVIFVCMLCVLLYVFAIFVIPGKKREVCLVGLIICLLALRVAHTRPLMNACELNQRRYN